MFNLFPDIKDDLFNTGHFKKCPRCSGVMCQEESMFSNIILWICTDSGCSCGIEIDTKTKTETEVIIRKI